MVLTYHARLRVRSLMRYLVDYRARLNAPLPLDSLPIQRRIGWTGISTAGGHILFWWLWTSVSPQPYENIELRLCCSLLGLAMVGLHRAPERWHGALYACFIWFTQGFAFSALYWLNHGNIVWTATVALGVLFILAFSDWRIAVTGISSGLWCGWVFAYLVGGHPPQLDAAIDSGLVVLFSLYVGSILNWTARSLRDSDAERALATIAILAHEFRTPISLISMAGSALENAAQAPGGVDPVTVTNIANRIERAARTMHRQIDSQISNARFLRISETMGSTQVMPVIDQVVSEFGYRSPVERAMVVVESTADFKVQCTATLLGQVIDNLLRNALFAVASTGRPANTCRVVISTAWDEGMGIIVISDNGIGISRDVARHLFQPFFSTAKGTAHGLGLVFCKRVVQAAHGTIRVDSTPGAGAKFTIRIPADGLQHARQLNNQ